MFEIWKLYVRFSDDREKLSEELTTRGQSYKTFYTLGQIYKRTLKHVKNALGLPFNPSVIEG